MTQINVHADSHEYPVAVQAGGVPRSAEALVGTAEDSLTPVGDLASHRAAKAQESQMAATAEEQAASDQATRRARAGFVDASVHQGAGDNVNAMPIPGRSAANKASRWMLGKIGGKNIIKRSQNTLDSLEDKFGYRERTHTALIGPAPDPEITSWRQDQARGRHQRRLHGLGQIGTR